MPPRGEAAERGKASTEFLVPSGFIDHIRVQEPEAAIRVGQNHPGRSRFGGVFNTIFGYRCIGLEKVKTFAMPMLLLWRLERTGGEPQRSLSGCHYKGSRLAAYHGSFLSPVNLLEVESTKV